MDQDALNRLRAINERLSALPAHCASDSSLPDLTGVLVDLENAAEYVARLARESNSEVISELAKYRSQLERLRLVLPELHGRLLAEKARLQRERLHLQAAGQWTRGGKLSL